MPPSRGFHTPYSPGRAWMQGPGRFGHVIVDGAGGLGGPAGQVQSAIVSNTNQCDQHSAPVRKRYRAPWSQSWRVELRAGRGGPTVRLGPLRVGESTRLTGAGAQWLALPTTMTARACPRFDARACPRNLAVWRSGSGRVASGLSPRGVASFMHARLEARGYQGRLVSNLPSPRSLNLLPVPPGCPRGVSR